MKIVPIIRDGKIVMGKFNDIQKLHEILGGTVTHPSKGKEKEKKKKRIQDQNQLCQPKLKNQKLKKLLLK